MNLATQEPRTFLPLTPVVFHILMALSSENRHGYAIIKEVQTTTEGRVNIQTGTLYQAIKRLLDSGVINETDSKVDPALDDQRRRYYTLSGLGKRVLSEEAQRLESMVKLARAKQVLSSGQAAFALGQR